MSHNIYKTEGFVLGGSNFGESNKILFIFTRELGFIMASAQGLRNLKSKLKYSLQDFSFSELSIVRGKNMWKVTNAKEKSSLYSAFKENEEALKMCASIFLFLKKMLAGEERDEVLFEIISSAFSYLSGFTAEKILESVALKNFELILMLRILNRLGYVGASENFSVFAGSHHWDSDVVEKMSISRNWALAEINKAIRESQMVK